MRSLAEILDPNFRSKQQDRQLRIEIESARLQQKGQTHYDQMNLGYDKLRQENQIHNSSLAQSDKHHNDKMSALSRQNDIREKQLNSRIELDEKKLAFDIETALSNRDMTLYTARLQALTSIKLAEMGHHYSIEQLNQAFRNQTSIITTQSHADFTKSVNMLFVDKVSSQLKRGNDINSAYSMSLAKKIEIREQFKAAYKLAEQQEKNRENERKHEVTMAILKSNLDRADFTYEEILKFAIRLIDPTSPEEHDDLDRRVSEWYKTAKSDLEKAKA